MDWWGQDFSALVPDHFLAAGVRPALREVIQDAQPFDELSDGLERPSYRYVIPCELLNVSPDSASPRRCR